MMKRLLALPLVLALSSCGPTFPTIDSAALREAVAQVQGYTVEICKYLPTNESVVGILTQTSEVVETAYAIAQHICAAVTEQVTVSPVQTPRVGDSDQCPMVRGVCIEGRFIAPEKKDASP